MKHVSPLDRKSGVPLYEQTANRIENMVREGVLLPGDRIPSIRRIRNMFNVSVSTAVEACHTLEDKGIITARPQSGHYVNDLPVIELGEPSPSKTYKRPYRLDQTLPMQLVFAIEDPSIVQLGASIPNYDLMPFQTLARLTGKIMREQPVRTLGYSASRGLIECRRVISKRMMHAGISVGPEQITMTSGAIESVYLALKAVTKPGDTVAIECPTFYDFIETLKSLHLKTLSIGTHPRDGISFKGLGEALQNKRVQAVLIISNFSNPLGVCMSSSRKEALVKMLKRYNVPLIEDDIYGDLSFDNTRPKAAKAFDKHDQVIYCSSYSKTIAPGLRVGWTVGGIWQQQIEQIKLAVNHASSSVGQMTIAHYLNGEGYDRHLRKLRKVYQRQMHLISRYISEYFPSQTRISRPTGGHILWVELPKMVDSIALYEQAMANKIAIAPGPIFCPGMKLYRNCLRLNTGLTWDDRVEPAIQRLGELINDQMINCQT
ncbi:PLP-dependent aminotransferase family protein [Poriferisphaera sp. WC338]|uniref:aminotransferase-like domain-containing protein n=1 Tax=Poriferisphaera sp. WC338 TaxID=3425129 RepID=UPI003D816E55